ncbi:MAG: hypothetical protein P1V20_13650 [Verrucomicrobiales bacterium]|nr:hypothetical protein [Verrucomicrobiales bacterium]
MAWPNGNSTIVSLNLNQCTILSYNADSPEFCPNIAGQVGVDFELGNADRILPDDLGAFRLEVFNYSMIQPELALWRGREKIAHFSGGLNGPESASVAGSVMEYYHHELKKEHPGYLHSRFPGGTIPSPCVLSLFYPGFDNLSSDDKVRQTGIIHSIMLGIHFMANC